MKSLDDFIKRNAELFDTEEPLDGHFGRFDNKLEKAYRRNTMAGMGTLMRIAAIVLLGVILTFLALREAGFVNRNLGYMVTSGENTELSEAEKYYSMQMDLYYSKIRNLRFGNDKAQKKQILDELSDMDRQVMSLKHDLRLNPDDERIVHAIINHYQVKLEFMDMIITRTEETIHTIL